MVKKLMRGLYLMGLPLLPGDAFQFQGRFLIEHIRNGEVLSSQFSKNLVTTVGKNLALDVVFGAVVKPSAWYIGLMNQATFSGHDVTDTMSAHPGWSEWTTYSEATRQQWVTAAAANAAISNPTAATFNITGSGTLQGMFITTSNTKAGTSGTLWSSVQFNATVPVQNGDQIKVTYTVNCP